MELLESLAGYIGIAIQNAQLYRRLEQKITEFESLKEFHENIVESINIGVFAVDLDDRIESWNTQMETMYEKPRGEVLRQPISAVLPPEFVAQIQQRARRAWHSHALQVSAGAAERKRAYRQYRDCAAGHAELRRGGPHHSGGRHYRPHSAGGSADPVGEAVVDRLAGRGCRARGEYAAGGHLQLHADADQTYARR